MLEILIPDWLIKEVIPRPGRGDCRTCLQDLVLSIWLLVLLDDSMVGSVLKLFCFRVF